MCIKTKSTISIKMSNFIGILALVLVVILGVNGHTYHAGRCPGVQPAPNFNMTRFLGLWYAVQKTRTVSTCVTYNFVADAEPTKYLVQQSSQNIVLRRLPVKHNVKYTGIISPTSNNIPGAMEVKFPLNVVGRAIFTVFSTDYDTYAGIYTCQNLALFHRASATILSRTPTLDSATILRLRRILEGSDFHSDALSTIDHSQCPINDNQGINIDINEGALHGLGIGTRFGDDDENIDLEALAGEADDDWIRL